MNRLRWFALLAAWGLAWLAFPLAAQADTSPYLLFAEDFETPGLPGWNFWVSTGEGAVESVPELPNLGGTAPNNNLMAGIQSAPGEQFVGGIWTTVPVPLGIPLLIDGFWRSDGSAQMSLFAFDYDGTNAPVSGNPPPFPPPLPVYQTGPGSFDGIMFDTHQGVLLESNGQHPFTSGSTTGELLIVLQMNAGPSGGSAFVDDLWLQVVPEPSTYLMAILGVGLLIPAVYRNRRRRRGTGQP